MIAKITRIVINTGSSFLVDSSLEQRRRRECTTPGIVT
jgi:hypothetical protein